MWESAFLAVGVLLGERGEDVAARLPDEGQARVRELARRLAARERRERAHVLAEALYDVSMAIERVSLR